MTEAPILRDLVVLLAAGLPIVLVFQRLKMPSVVGFLIAGIIIGPHGVGLIADSGEIDRLAELGLVLLLFVVGLELSFAQLARLGRAIVWSGSLQIVATTGIIGVVALQLGCVPAEALLLGFLVVHSSTAIVLKVLTERAELDAPHGRFAVGICVIQDLSLVPMVLLTRLLATPGSASWLAIGAVLGKSAAAVALIVLAARLVMPALLRQIVALRSRELFTGTIVLFCLGTAWLASQFGLSLALGALIAGLVLSESEYSHQAVADVLPFRDTFNSVFFISIGMLLHVDFFANHLSMLLATAAGIIGFKTIVVVAGILPFYRSLRVAATTALALAQIGEVSFVLARVAFPSGLLPAAHYEAFDSVAVLTMLAAPFLINAAPGLIARWQRRRGSAEQESGAGTPEQNHVLVIGYGLNGQNLAHVLQQTGLSYVIVDLNPDTVAAARQRGEPILYGDATRPEVLRKAGAAAAHVIVIAISDRVATQHIVALARQSNLQAPIIVRTRYVAEIDELQRLGATEVIPEEYETSVEIFARVLRRLRVPRNIITLQVDLVRKQGYSMLRGLQLPRQTLDQLDQILAATTAETFLVLESSPAACLTIRELKLRSTTGVTIMAIVRNAQPFTNPAPDFQIAAGDILVLLGSHAQLDQALGRLGAAAATAESLG